MIKKTRVLTLFLMSLLLGSSVMAATSIRLTSSTAQQLIQQFNQSQTKNSVALQANSSITFVVQRKSSDGAHIRYDQLFRGVKVYGQQIITHARNGIVERINGNFLQEIEKDVNSVTPQLSLEQALKIAQGTMPTGNWRYENIQNELSIYLYQSKAKLVYSVNFFADTPSGTPMRPQFFIDAHTGEVLQGLDVLTTPRLQ